MTKLYSPRKKDFREKAKIKEDSTKCKYINKYTKQKCHNNIGIYPEYCKMHTLIINNVYIDKSNISVAGNGLYAGPYGFKKGEVIGIYSNPQSEVSLGELLNRCNDIEKNNCWEYVFCKDGHRKNTKCWDNLDIRSSLMRNINDAHNTNFKNNSYFQVKNNKIYIISSRNIKAKEEIFISYGKDYWN